jgi:hypothetical protein
MRHPMSNPCGEFEGACPPPVGRVGGFVVRDAFVQTAPQDFEPSVAGHSRDALL